MASKRGSAAKIKEKPKTPAVQIKELTEENEHLKNKLTTSENELVELKSKVAFINRQVMSSLEPRLLRENHNISENADPLGVSMETISDILKELAVRRKVYETSVEAQLENVEKQLTKLSFDLAKMSKKTLAYEQTMNELEDCENAHQIRDKIQHMKFIAGQGYESYYAADPVHAAEHFKPITGINGPGDRPEYGMTRTLENVKNLNLIPPKKRLPGETHILDMDKNLKLYLMVELSLEKPAGNDWRRLAERVGIELETIEEWQSQNLQYAMSRVFNFWEQTPEATVRQLHRHLKSPQMKAMFLAKWVSDYYNVD